MTQSSTNEHDADSMNERQYTRFIVEVLNKGTQPPLDKGKAGQFADLLDLLIEEYEPADLASFRQSLEALKGLHKTFKEVLEETGGMPPPNPDYVASKKGEQVFKRLSGMDVWNLPDIDWLVSGILQRTTTTLVVGSGNVGKTFMWLDLCMCIAYGLKWLEHKTRQGRVLYIYAEGSGGLKQRYKAWMVEHGKATLREITEPTDQISFIARPVNLLNDRDMLFRTIEDEPETPEEVVIDTFSMCASGVEENSNSQVALYLATASEIKLKYGCHVTIIHHCNKSGGFRGASALRDNVDTMITLDREDEESSIEVACGKQRDAEYFPKFALNLKVVELGINAFTNEPITSCVIELADENNPGASAKASMPEKQVKMLDILTLHGSLSTGQWQKRCNEEADISKDSFNYNLKMLVETGRVQKTEYISGKQKRVSYSLTNAGDADED